MRVNFFVESNGEQVLANDLITRAKNEWKSEGGKVKDISTINLYYKPEEQTCYYVINEASQGKFDV